MLFLFLTVFSRGIHWREVNIIEQPSLSHAAVALVKGGPSAPALSGTVQFYDTPEGVLVSARIDGLPSSNPTGFFAFHIHEGGSCAAPGGHFNPAGMPHPMHPGALPPLLSCGGMARMSVLTNRFRIRDILGRTVVIHSGTDDFRSQPAGNPGEKIACGVIRPF